MYAEFYGFSREPFSLSPDPRFCYRHPTFAKAKAYFEFAIHRGEGFVVVTGRPGTGKTTLVHDLVSDLRKSLRLVARIDKTQVEADDLLRLVAYAFDVNPQGLDKATLLTALEQFLLHKVNPGNAAILIVDEAQNLPSNALEELRLVTNLCHDTHPLVQIFLVGQEALRAKIRSPSLEQLHQRVVASCHLDPLNAVETRGYVEHRLLCAEWSGDPVIRGDALGVVFSATSGIPRLVNKFCARLLVHGYVEGRHTLTEEDARIVLGELRDEALQYDEQFDHGFIRSLGVETADQSLADLSREAPSPQQHADDVVIARPEDRPPQQEVCCVSENGLTATSPDLEAEGPHDGEQTTVKGPTGSEQPDGDEYPTPKATPDSLTLGAEIERERRPEDGFRPSAPPGGEAWGRQLDSGRDGDGLPEALTPPVPSFVGVPEERVSRASAGTEDTPRRAPHAPRGRKTRRWVRGALAAAVSVSLTGGLYVLGPARIESFGVRGLAYVRDTADRLAAEWEGASGRPAPEADVETDLGPAAGGAASEQSVATQGAHATAGPSVSVGAGTGDQRERDSAARDLASEAGAAVPGMDDDVGSGHGASARPVAEAPTVGGDESPDNRVPSASFVQQATVVPGAQTPDPHPFSLPVSDAEGGEQSVGTPMGGLSDLDSPASSRTAGVADMSPTFHGRERPARDEHLATTSAGQPVGSGTGHEDAADAAIFEPVSKSSAAEVDPLDEQLRAAGLPVERALQGDLTLNLQGEIQFAVDSATVPEAAYGTLHRLAEVLVKFPRATLRVIGHTDHLGAPDYNRRLSLRRAEAVAGYLERQGVSMSRISVEGRGEEGSHNTEPGNGAALLANDRRIDVVIRRE
ncbi:MAG: AAA family ATPase [Chromatiaceae bacterium]